LKKDAKLSEAFLKTMSGGDTIVARQNYKSEIEFRAKYQTVFQSNYRPAFNSLDSGNRRRYLELPFDNVLKYDPEVEVDTGLRDRLINDKLIHEAVLAWIVEGAVEWRKNGLQIPQCVRAATEELFKQNDFLGDFWSECIRDDKDSDLPLATLWAVYEAWCDGASMEPVKARTFTKLLHERGLQSKSCWIEKKSVKAWPGIKLTKQAAASVETQEETEERLKANRSKMGAR
jgi:P4 family phage/plasmid primase-like protien